MAARVESEVLDPMSAQHLSGTVDVDHFISKEDNDFIAPFDRKQRRIERDIIGLQGSVGPDDLLWGRHLDTRWMETGRTEVRRIEIRRNHEGQHVKKMKGRRLPNMVDTFERSLGKRLQFLSRGIDRRADCQDCGKKAD